MIKIVGNDILRAEEKIGWVEGSHICAHDGTKLGYFDGMHVYNMNAQKIAYIEENYLISEGSHEGKIPLEKINEEVTGGVLPEIGKCAIYVLLD